MTRNDRKPQMAMISALSALALSTPRPGAHEFLSEPREPRTDKHRDTGQGSRERRRRMRQLERQRKAESRKNQAAA